MKHSRPRVGQGNTCLLHIRGEWLPLIRSLYKPRRSRQRFAYATLDNSISQALSCQTHPRLVIGDIIVEFIYSCKEWYLGNTR